jgi:hypothetical protein
LLLATPMAMLAKVSSPLYCAGPALVALWYLFRPASSSVKSVRNNSYVVMMFAAGLLLNLAAIRWYSRNITRVIQHVSISSSGPIAEIYGKTDTFLNTMMYWVGALRNSFFLPSIFLLSSALFASAVSLHLIKRRLAPKHFTMCTLIALSQIVIVLTVFSFSTNRELRYLLPLLPYVGLVICWSVAQIGAPILAGLATLLFLAQLATTYGQALGLMTLATTTPGWLLVPNTISGQKESIALNAIVAKTCTDIGSQPYLNVIGIEKPWLNEHSANFLAAKHRVLHRPIGCRYGSFGYETDPDKIWNNILSNTRYYITMNPNSNPVPSEDAHLQAINRNYLPMLQTVQSSELFELQPPLPEDRAILIFHRNEIDRN